MPTKQNQKPTTLQSLTAGFAAGGVEALVTYPTEYIKTRQQLLSTQSGSSSPLRILVSTVRSSGVGILYTGAGAFCISNASKSGVRFLTFDTIRSRLPHDAVTGKPTAVSTMLAGVGAGIAESVTVVTPGENLKTKIVDARAATASGASVQFRSSTQVLKSIVATEGIAGLYRGVLPVSLKQGSNAFVRFSSYSAILDIVQPLMDRNGYRAVAPAVAGAFAGIITVYATMPFDVVKTKMQSLSGALQYSSTWDCVRQTWQAGGLTSFWKGTTPRLARLTVSGALSFSIYSGVVEYLQRSETQHLTDNSTIKGSL